MDRRRAIAIGPSVLPASGPKNDKFLVSDDNLRMPQSIRLKFSQMINHVPRVLGIASGTDRIFLRALPPHPLLRKITKYSSIFVSGQ